MKIPKSKWKWFGIPLHFCAADQCYFRLSTQVGDYLISTVGELDMPNLPGMEVGIDRKYETMVFKAGPPCAIKKCNCGIPSPANLTELEMKPYNTRKDAQEGHMAMCEKYSLIES